MGDWEGGLHPILATPEDADRGSKMGKGSGSAARLPHYGPIPIPAPAAAPDPLPQRDLEGSGAELSQAPPRSRP